MYIQVPSVPHSRQHKIAELRRRLQDVDPGFEQDTIRAELNFWLRRR